MSIVALFHHRWAVPVLAELHRRRGCRFVELSRGLGIAPESLRQTLAHLAELGLVERNPGYGHPLRPEYVLTGPGGPVGGRCARLEQEIAAAGAERAARRKWPLPALSVLADGSRRFSELRAALPGVTSRALALALKELEAAGLVERSVVGSYPPASAYTLTPRARRLARLTGRLL